MYVKGGGFLVGCFVLFLVDKGLVILAVLPYGR